jgi:hypothetical protein
VAAELSMAVVERVLDSHVLMFPLVTLTLGQQRLPRSDFVRPLALPGGARIPEIVDSGRVWWFFARGATIILQHAHAYIPEVGRCARVLAGLLGREVEAHVFVTPGFASEPAFRAHADALDAVILQIAGVKKWAIWGEELPTELLALTPGRVLVLPRGIFHLARPVSHGAATIHVTFGLRASSKASASNPREWAELPLSVLQRTAGERLGRSRDVIAWRSGVGLDSANFFVRVTGLRLGSDGALLTPSGEEVPVPAVLHPLVDAVLRSGDASGFWEAARKVAGPDLALALARGLVLTGVLGWEPTAK